MIGLPGQLNADAGHCDADADHRDTYQDLVVE
jgi:hypothetical protein